MNQDKLEELARYNERAQFQLSKSPTETPVHNMLGSATMPHYLRAPYIFYEQCIASLIKPDHKVLELGSGTGLHTVALVETKAQVVATDIAPNVLKVIEQKITDITTQVADIEALPFENSSFDVVACAGSLSYGDPLLVDAEIKRVLKPGGLFICVDSLNHNPIYRFNRWLHYLRGNRTKSTLQRMPNLQRIEVLTTGFKQTEVRYFGSISFVMPIIARLFGQEKAAHLSDYIDSAFSLQRSAFKFVLVAKNLQK
jgi:ubiquinone/menaquinone biosynthesis C-methylase UbiE